MLNRPEIKCPAHMKLVGREMVPIEYNDAQTKAYLWMLANGYRCNASCEGFSDGVKGLTRRDNPFSAIRDTIRHMRWDEGFMRARGASV
jgi:hypothetical protein